MKKNEKKKSQIRLFVNVTIWIIVSFLLLVLVETMNRGSLEETKKFIMGGKKIFLLNYFTFLAFTSIGFLFRKTRAIYFLISMVIVSGGVSSSMMMGFRGTPLAWADLYSVKDGLSVAGEYLTKDTVSNVLIALAVIAVIIIVLLLTERKLKGSKFINVKGLFVIIPITLLTAETLQYNRVNKNIKLYLWDLPATYSQNGFIVSFLATEQGFKVNKPGEYNKESIANIKSTIDDESYLYEAENSVKPNIIILQLESFFDPYRLEGVEFTEDPIPNFRKLAENYSSGLALVPTFGGGTVRSEFEVLTGLSTDYLPVGNIPNNDILKKGPVESLAYNLKSYEYDTSVVHNYIGNFYDRDIVFSNLGFDTYVPVEFMENSNFNGSFFPSDLLNLNTMEKLISQDSPQFIYNITVESHGGYSKDYKTENYTVSGDMTEGQRNQLQEYVNKLKGVDEYIGQLMEYIENSNEPTIVAMFGDHLPALEIIDQSKNFDASTKYAADYFIWDNLGCKKVDGNIEAYQLSTNLLNLAGLQGGTVNKFHNVYGLTDYYQENFKMLQYDMLYGHKYIYDGEIPFQSSNLKLGIEDIAIDEYFIDGDVLVVKGKNFNTSSRIIINAKEVETTFEDENTLTTTKLPKTGQDIKVSQVGRYSKILGGSNELNFE